jgi:hypothetical protein
VDPTGAGGLEASLDDRLFKRVFGDSLNEIQVLHTLTGNNKWIAIFAAAFCVCRWLPWWIAAMRAAIHDDDARTRRARKAIKAIRPRRRRDRTRNRPG